MTSGTRGTPPHIDVPAACCADLTSTALDDTEAENLARTFKSLADPVRLRLLSLIATSPNGEVCACDLPQLVERSQPTISHHLSHLTRVGLIEREQRGKWAWFRARPAAMEELRKALGEK